MATRTSHSHKTTATGSSYSHKLSVVHTTAFAKTEHNKEIARYNTTTEAKKSGLKVSWSSTKGKLTLVGIAITIASLFSILSMAGFYVTMAMPEIDKCYPDCYGMFTIDGTNAIFSVTTNISKVVWLDKPEFVERIEVLLVNKTNGNTNKIVDLGHYDFVKGSNNDYIVHVVKKENVKLKWNVGTDKNVIDPIFDKIDSSVGSVSLGSKEQWKITRTQVDKYITSNFNVLEENSEHIKINVTVNKNKIAGNETDAKNVTISTYKTGISNMYIGKELLSTRDYSTTKEISSLPYSYIIEIDRTYDDVSVELNTNTELSHTETVVVTIGSSTIVATGMYFIGSWGTSTSLWYGNFTYPNGTQWSIINPNTGDTNYVGISQSDTTGNYFSFHDNGDRDWYVRGGNIFYLEGGTDTTATNPRTYTNNITYFRDMIMYYSSQGGKHDMLISYIAPTFYNTPMSVNSTAFVASGDLIDNTKYWWMQEFTQPEPDVSICDMFKGTWTNVNLASNSISTAGRYYKYGVSGDLPTEYLSIWIRGSGVTARNKCYEKYHQYNSTVTVSAITGAVTSPNGFFVEATPTGTVSEFTIHPVNQSERLYVRVKFDDTMNGKTLYGYNNSVLYASWTNSSNTWSCDQGAGTEVCNTTSVYTVYGRTYFIWDYVPNMDVETIYISDIKFNAQPVVNQVSLGNVSKVEMNDEYAPSVIYSDADDWQDVEKISILIRLNGSLVYEKANETESTELSDTKAYMNQTTKYPFNQLGNYVIEGKVSDGSGTNQSNTFNFTITNSIPALNWVGLDNDSVVIINSTVNPSMAYTDLNNWENVNLIYYKLYLDDVLIHEHANDTASTEITATKAYQNQTETWLLNVYGDYSLVGIIADSLGSDNVTLAYNFSIENSAPSTPTLISPVNGTSTAKIVPSTNPLNLTGGTDIEGTATSAYCYVYNGTWSWNSTRIEADTNSTYPDTLYSNTTYTWSCKASDNTGQANENSSYATEKFFNISYTIESLNISLSTGTRLSFLPRNATQYCVEAYNQTQTRSVFKSYNDQNYTLTIWAKINETNTNITVGCYYANSCSLAVNLTTSYQQISNKTLSSGWNYLWCWAGYSNNNQNTSWHPLWSFKGELEDI